MLSYQSTPRKSQGISIVGIGGAGAGILQCFGASSAENVKLYTASLDERVRLALGENFQFIQLGGGLNHGLGSGGDPEVGRRAAEDSREELEAMLEDTRLLVMVAGLGGGTGSGAAPVLAKLAKEKGVFLVSVLIMPFSFEGTRRRAQAEKAHEEIARQTDILFCFENDYMENLFSNNRGARAVFEEVDRVLAKATAAIPMLETSPGLINLGLDELAMALENNDSRCLFGSGKGYGPHRAENAARAALESPLVAYHGALRFARTVIVHVAGGENMSVQELREAVETVKNALADDDVTIFFGATVKPHLGDEVRVTLIASLNSAEFTTALNNPEAAVPAAEVPAPAPQEDVVEKETEAAVEEEEEPTTPAAEEESPEETEEEETNNDDDEEEGVTTVEENMQQGELMPMEAARPLTDADQVERARKLFEEVDSPSASSPLQHHDLRNIFH